MKRTFLITKRNDGHWQAQEQQAEKPILTTEDLAEIETLILDLAQNLGDTQVLCTMRMVRWS